LVIAGSALAEPPPHMAAVPAGAYTPLMAATGPVAVASFLLDEKPVTNGEYLEFVRANEAWRRSHVKRLFADDAYLQHWAGDLDFGTSSVSSPVTRVSWFAAKAYATWKGKRLPTQDEWEFAALASETNAVGSDEPDFNQRILAWYSRPVRDVLPEVGSTFRNVYGVWDLHGLVWEWVSDFNTALVTGESRADSAIERQLYCGSGAAGATSFRDYAAFMRYAYRSSLKANYCVANLGFRCAKDMDAK
jgi:formylglycine-generating enzyme required for sulfatase activity